MTTRKCIFIISKQKKKKPAQYTSFANKKISGRAGEMPLWLRALAVLLEKLISVPSYHMVANNLL